MMSSSDDSTNLRQDRADFHSDRSRPASTTQEGKESGYSDDSRSATHKRNEGKQSTTVSGHSTHIPQDGAPSTEQRRSSSRHEQRDTASRSQPPPPPPSGVRKPREETVTRQEQGNLPPDPDSVSVSRSTVPQSQDQRESQEIKQGHQPVQGSDDDGQQRESQSRTSTRRDRESEWNRDGDESADESSNTKKDATSHRL
jgi:hypothetical protein